MYMFLGCILSKNKTVVVGERGMAVDDGLDWSMKLNFILMK